MAAFAAFGGRNEQQRWLNVVVVAVAARVSLLNRSLQIEVAGLHLGNNISPRRPLLRIALPTLLHDGTEPGREGGGQLRPLVAFRNGLAAVCGIGMSHVSNTTT